MQSPQNHTPTREDINKSILFDSEMVNALLDRRKTTFRKICDVNTQNLFKLMGTDKKTKRFEAIFEEPRENWIAEDSPSYSSCLVPFKKGDILYVKETFKPFTDITMENGQVGIEYKADRFTHVINDEDQKFYAFYDKWKPSPQLPQWASRILLKITDVRIEKLQDILGEDITDEGMDAVNYTMKDNKKLYNNDTHGEVDYYEDAAEEWFIDIWNKSSKAGFLWEDNPYVFVYEFETFILTEERQR